MNTEKTKALEDLIEKTESAMRSALSAIGPTSSPANDADSAKAVLCLAKARAALITEYIALDSMEAHD